MRGFAVAVVIALGGLLGGAGAASAEVVWLCKPGEDPNPCAESLETTIQEEGGDRVENPPLATDPAVDCFYVYPTVSQQPGSNANKDKDPEILAIARYQAARYSQVCQVYAPMYRQQTLAGLGAGGSADALALAYSDVEEAWRDYLANHSRGRGVVLIGHSQGTRMLRRLIRDEIDPRPEVVQRTVGAILLGGNVTVRKGAKVGGDFQNIPACTAPGQIRCVVAWSTFGETPPDNSRYGREPAQDTSGFGFPSGPDFEVLCTNPASLDENARSPITSLLRSEPFPGLIGALLVQMYGGPQPSADTPWLQPRERYTGACERSNDANVFMLEPIGSARKLNASPTPDWGLHLADANIALGELVANVGRQIETYTAPPRTFSPRAFLRIVCGRRPGMVRVFVAGPDRAHVRRLVVRRGRRVLARDRRAPLSRRVKRGRLRATMVMRDGRRITFTLRLPRCGVRR